VRHRCPCRLSREIDPYSAHETTIFLSGSAAIAGLTEGASRAVRPRPLPGPKGLPHVAGGATSRTEPERRTLGVIFGILFLDETPESAIARSP
jgi:hypothetical protein